LGSKDLRTETKNGQTAGSDFVLYFVMITNFVFSHGVKGKKIRVPGTQKREKGASDAAGGA
jgi:hypothetical protein